MSRILQSLYVDLSADDRKSENLYLILDVLDCLKGAEKKKRE
jgi:hypothetical protein